MLKSFVTVFIVLSFIIISQTFGQQGLTPKMREQMAKADSAYAARSSDEKKMPDALYNILRMAEEADTSVKTQQNLKKMLSIKSPLQADSKNRIMFELGIRPRSAVHSVAEVIKSLDGTIISAGWNMGYIVCRIQLKALRKLVALPSVVSIGIVPGPIRRTIVSAGNSQLKADSVQSKYMSYGDNVKVGVISDGIDHRQVVKDNFELPTINFINAGSGDEGTAMLEIVHDLAPNASLYFNSCGNTYQEFGHAIRSLDSAGCNIIVDDIGYPDEPYFSNEDDTLGAAIRYFLWHGGTYISAEGNDNRSIYNDPEGYSIYSGKTNIGPENLNIFANSQTFIDCTVDPNSSDIYFSLYNESFSLPKNSLLKLSNNNVEVQPTPDNLAEASSVWLADNNILFISGTGLFRRSYGKWEQIKDFGLLPVNKIRGKGFNDIFIAGSYGLIAHFNGITWTRYNNPNLSNVVFGSIAESKNLLIAVGFLNDMAVAVVGRKQ